MQAELSALLALQTKDLEILDLQRKIEHLAQRSAQLERQREQAQAHNRKQHEALEAKRLESRKLSDEVDHLDDHLRNQRRKLEKEIISFKEMEAIKASLEHGKEHIDALEEQALQLMDEVEALAQRVAQEDQAFARREAQLNAEQQKISAQIEQHRQALDRARAERQALWEAVPERLRATYTRLRANVADPLAPLRGNTCEGCQLQVSAQLVEQVRQDTSLVPCEHCARILYLP